MAGPVVLYRVAPTRAADPLRSMKEFMAANNAAIMVEVFLVLGTKLLGSGIAGL